MGEEQPFVLLNGKWLKRNEAVVDIEDRGYQFGDGIYEVIRVYGGHSFMMDEHLQRLKRSAEEMKLTLPEGTDELHQQLEELKAKNDLHNGIIYIQVSRGVAPRNHGFPEPDTAVQMVAYTKPMERPLDKQKVGAKAILTEDIRWLRCDIKSINLLGNVLAKQKAADAGAYEAIQHRDDIVTEGSATNVFIVKDNILYTHPATPLILNGITRQKILQLCHNLQLTIREQTFTTQALLGADEIFITSSTNEVMPIVQVDDQPIGSGDVGSVTEKIQKAFDQDIQSLAN